MVDGRITSEEHKQQFQNQQEVIDHNVVDELLNNPERVDLKNYIKDNFDSIVEDANNRNPKFAVGNFGIPLDDEEKLFAMQAIEAILHGNLTEDQL